MTTYVIHHGIPPPPPVVRNLPGSRTGPVSELSKTMDAMKVDDYFDISTKKERQDVAARWHILRPKRFCVRREGKGWRVWRIA